uniref:Uncharacterized protein n=1 Tax=Brassica campestris TaxID=3711 RepID=M4EQ88_BRACM
MSLILSHSPKIFIRKPVLIRASAGGSSSPLQTPPCYINGAKYAPDNVELRFAYPSTDYPKLKKKAPVELVYNDINDPITPWLAEKFEEGNKVSDAAVAIGSSHGWVASLLHGVGILRLHDDLNPAASCNIPGPAQKGTQMQEAQEEETLDITPPTAYKRRSSPRVQPQERQQAKPCPSRTPPPPPPQAAAAPPPAKPAASRPRSPSRRDRAPSRRLLDSVSCKQLRSEP